jgi:uncharacterized protein with FMN-binding domain
VRTRAVLTSVFASAAVLVIGWQVGGAALTTETAPADGTAASASGSGSGSGSGSSGTADSSDTAPTTYTGDSVSTRFGAVQVAITVQGGAITDVIALQLTDKEQRSVQISNAAAPILRSEVLASQSAQVDSVSGATYTSEAYLTSLQSAIDQAGL